MYINYSYLSKMTKLPGLLILLEKQKSFASKICLFLFMFEILLKHCNALCFSFCDNHTKRSMNSSEAGKRKRIKMVAKHCIEQKTK